MIKLNRTKLAFLFIVMLFSKQHVLKAQTPSHPNSSSEKSAGLFFQHTLPHLPPLISKLRAHTQTDAALLPKEWLESDASLAQLFAPGKGFFLHGKDVLSLYDRTLQSASLQEISHDIESLYYQAFRSYIRNSKMPLINKERTLATVQKLFHNSASRRVLTPFIIRYFMISCMSPKSSRSFQENQRMLFSLIDDFEATIAATLDAATNTGAASSLLPTYREIDAFNTDLSLAHDRQPRKRSLSEWVSGLSTSDTLKGLAGLSALGCGTVVALELHQLIKKTKDVASTAHELAQNLKRKASELDFIETLLKRGLDHTVLGHSFGDKFRADIKSFLEDPKKHEALFTSFIAALFKAKSGENRENTTKSIAEVFIEKLLEKPETLTNLVRAFTEQAFRVGHENNLKDVDMFLKKLEEMGNLTPQEKKLLYEKALMEPIATQLIGKTIDQLAEHTTKNPLFSSWLTTLVCAVIREKGIFEYSRSLADRAFKAKNDIANLSQDEVLKVIKLEGALKALLMHYKTKITNHTEMLSLQELSDIEALTHKIKILGEKQILLDYWKKNKETIKATLNKQINPLGNKTAQVGQSQSNCRSAFSYFFILPSFPQDPQDSLAEAENKIQTLTTLVPSSNNTDDQPTYVQIQKITQEVRNILESVVKLFNEKKDSSTSPLPLVPHSPHTAFSLT